MFLLEGEEEGDDERARIRGRKTITAATAQLQFQRGKIAFKCVPAPYRKWERGGLEREEACIQHLLSAKKHCPVCEKLQCCLNPYRIGCRCYYSHFTDQKTKVQRE